MRTIKLLFFLCFLFLTNTVVAQANSDVDVLNKFVKAVFINEKIDKKTIEDLIYLEPSNNKKYPVALRLRIIKKRLKALKKEVSHLLNTKDFDIVPFKSYKMDRINF